MSRPCTDPLELRDLIAYERGELTGEAADHLEAHYFDCAPCTRALEGILRLGSAIADLVTTGLASAAVSPAFLERIEAAGFTLRTYRLAPGDLVPCTAAPEDDFIVLRLGLGPLGPAATVDLTATALDRRTGTSESFQRSDVVVDHAGGELIYLHSGDEIRALPATRWTLEAHVSEAGSTRRLGPFTLEHTPWELLAEPR
jgi:hypothetical protein